MIYGVPEALLLRTPEIAGQFLSIFNPKNQKGSLFEQEIFDLLGIPFACSGWGNLLMSQIKMGISNIKNAPQLRSGFLFL